MITLRSVTPADVDFIVQAEHHPDNRLYIGQWNHAQHRQALEDSRYRYLVFQADGQPVGYAILADLDNTDDSVLLKRIVVTEKGKGYGKAALQMIIAYVFRELPAHRLWLDVRAFNTRADKLYQQAGFRYEGSLKQASKVDTEYHDLKIYAMLREEFEGRMG